MDATCTENPEDRRLGSKPKNDGGGEILGSKVNGNSQPADGASPFGLDDAPQGPMPF